MNPFTRDPRRSVAARGERRLIEDLRRWLGDATPRAPFGIGDDCAVVPSGGRPLLITTDPVIFGRHFDAAVPAAAAGAKLLKRNLSDIAAMGGRPVAAVVSLALAAETRIAWLRAFHRGLAAAAIAHGVRIVGGDVAQAPAGFLGAFLTLHGEAAADRVVTRTGARRGDALYVTGALGGSRLGHHHRFEPRLAAGAWLACRPEVRAMMDLSDGLAKDVRSLCPAGLEPAIDPAAVPVSPAAARLARRTGRTPLAHALGDGEDYELLVVVGAGADPARFAAAWKRRFPALPLTRLGTFVRAGRLPAGALDLDRHHGYEHLRPAP
jgi:thiamine-monophosphate kinase